MSNKSQTLIPIVTPKGSDCWLWAGSVDGYGHPICSIKGRVHRVQYLHFERQYGYKPVRICTSCGDKACVNPKHLLDKRKKARAEACQAELGVILPRIEYLTAAVQSLEGEQGEEAVKVRQDFTKELETLNKRKEELISESTK